MSADNRRADRLIVLLLFVIATALMLPYLLNPDAIMWPRSGLGTDLLTFNLPPLEYVRNTLDEYGQIPLWQTTAMAGLPLIGNPALRVFYPPQFVLTLLPIPALTVFALLDVLHLWLSGLGGYGLGRLALGLERPAAVFGALALMLTPRTFSNLTGDTGYTYGMCWVALCLLCTWLAFERRSWRWALAAGAALATVYLLNIQFILYVGWLVAAYGLYAGFFAWRQARNVRDLLIYAGIGGLIVAVCIGLAAYQMFPFITYLPYQSREAMTLQDGDFLALPIPLLIHTVIPIPYKFPEWELYAGLLPILFAPLAGFRESRKAGFWWGLLIFSVWLSLGSAALLYAVVFQFVPGFRLLRAPSRIWYFAAMALAILAAMGVNRLLTQPERTKRALRWLVIGGALLAVFSVIGRYLTRRPNELDWMLGLLAAAGVVVALAGVWLWQRGRISRERVIGMLLVGLLLDLVPLAIAFAEPLPEAEAFALPTIAQPILDQRGEEPFRIYSVRHELKDHVLVRYGLESAEGLNSFQFAPYVRLMTAASGCSLTGRAAAVPLCVSSEISNTAYRDAVPDMQLLGLLNARYIIAPFELSPQPELVLLAAIGDERLYENTAVLPRAFAVGRVEQVAEDGLWARLPETDVRTTALVSAVSSLPETLPNSDFFILAEDISHQPGRIEVSVTLPERGMLVFSEAWVPGWTIDVDGQSQPALRVNGALVGTPLEAGDHRVWLTFAPPALTAGLVISGVTLAVCLLALVVARRKKGGNEGKKTS